MLDAARELHLAEFAGAHVFDRCGIRAAGAILRAALANAAELARDLQLWKGFKVMYSQGAGAPR